MTPGEEIEAEAVRAGWKILSGYYAEYRTQERCEHALAAATRPVAGGMSEEAHEVIEIAKAATLLHDEDHYNSETCYWCRLARALHALYESEARCDGA